jgi:hypothetical protein
MLNFPKLYWFFVSPLVAVFIYLWQWRKPSWQPILSTWLRVVVYLMYASISTGFLSDLPICSRREAEELGYSCRTVKGYRRRSRYMVYIIYSTPVLWLPLLAALLYVLAAFCGHSRVFSRTLGGSGVESMDLTLPIHNREYESVNQPEGQIRLE